MLQFLTTPLLVIGVSLACLVAIHGGTFLLKWGASVLAVYLIVDALKHIWDTFAGDDDDDLPQHPASAGEMFH